MHNFNNKFTKQSNRAVTARAVRNFQLCFSFGNEVYSAVMETNFHIYVLFSGIITTHTIHTCTNTDTFNLFTVYKHIFPITGCRDLWWKLSKRAMYWWVYAGSSFKIIVIAYCTHTNANNVKFVHLLFLRIVHELPGIYWMFSTSKCVKFLNGVILWIRNLYFNYQAYFKQILYISIARFLNR